MTLGDKIWSDAVGKIGAGRLWTSPQEAVAELGREVILAINANVADLRRDYDGMLADAEREIRRLHRRH